MWCCGSPSGRRIFVSLSDKAILLKNVSHEFDVIFWIRLKRRMYIICLYSGGVLNHYLDAGFLEQCSLYYYSPLGKHVSRSTDETLGASS